MSDKGLRIVDTNVVIGRGEIDLIALDDDELVAVEVRTITGEGDPIEAIDDRKRDHVAQLGRVFGADRVDLVGLRLDPLGMSVHWVTRSG